MATNSPHSSHTATQKTKTLVHSKPLDTYQLRDFGKSSKDIPFAARRHNGNHSIVRYENILCSEYTTIISLPRRLLDLVSSQQYTELRVHYRWHGLTCIAAQTENPTPTKALWPIQQQGGNLKQQQHEKLSLSQSECPAVEDLHHNCRRRAIHSKLTNAKHFSNAKSRYQKILNTSTALLLLFTDFNIYNLKTQKLPRLKRSSSEAIDMQQAKSP
jgi:hypothetical protein